MQDYVTTFIDFLKLTNGFMKLFIDGRSLPGGDYDETIKIHCSSGFNKTATGDVIYCLG